VFNVREGSVSSSTLLTGKAKANQEQYVYFDANKGNRATVTVKVGDKITAGQQLVQYDTTTAQAAYDTANRQLNKVARQINNLKTTGSLPAMESSDQSSSSSQGQGTQSTSGATNRLQQNYQSQANASYNQQLQDLNDAYADAQAEVNKAQKALNDTVITSDVSGTVVEVNSDIDPASKTSQVLVHVATEGKLQVQGTMSEYDLANVKKDQSVKIKSKVYPDKEWEGKISYISNYPEAEANNNDSNNGSSAVNYKYKVDITSPLDALKQGFTVSVEVVNGDKHLIVPTSSVINKDNKHFVWVYNDSNRKISKVEVKIGKADAKTQEILSGLKAGQIVVTNPSKTFKDGQKIDNIESIDLKSNKKSEVK
ncbi:efflux RND transporter periplasmic adaptor subunit, partial [Streptococcus agalactiae]|nr:efflux RND transporter periplasmic adaptor subunit [Streptococcus agalactiae]